MVDTKQKKAADCMAQHIKTFREQFLNGTHADFGAPCNVCQHNQHCNFEWLEIMQPILGISDVEINMVLTEQK